MAVYRIYPEKDTTIWSEPNQAGLYGNAGKDEIVEIGGYPDVDLVGRASRTLIKFDTNEILDTLSNKVTGDYTSSLHLYLANASELPQEYTVLAYPILSSWVNGVGKRDDNPINLTGASWKYRGNQTDLWNTLGGDYNINISGRQTNNLKSNHDLNIDITSIINAISASSIENHGILLKLEDIYENYLSASINLKYFGADSNTIFPPYLEFKWDDSIYSSTLDELTTDVATIKIKNHREKYSDSDIARFNISARPKYPVRSFTTSSIYLTEYKLPEETFYGIKDEFSGEMIVDFDSTYTKVSADNISSHFSLYMNSLQPERFYRLLIKTTLNGSTIVIDNNNVFKVTRNG